jgi:hypothetical protein
VIYPVRIERQVSTLKLCRPQGLECILGRGTLGASGIRHVGRVVDRWAWESTCGPVEHMKTSCEWGHWFTPTVDSLDLRPALTTAEPSPLPVPVD